ncbi:MAG: hypothetical protein GY715_15430 [Planctomycetes bacterium]|nr:hypothetical protein [Planctomycetota bacterium]
MRRSAGLNALLTVNATLLGAFLWMSIAPSIATAQSSGGIPNATEQRIETVKAIRDLQRSVDRLQRLLESGRLRTHMANVNDLESVLTRTRQAAEEPPGIKGTIRFTGPGQNGPEADWR